MADGSVDIDIKLEDAKAKQQASKTGNEIGKSIESGMKGASSAAKNTESQIKSAMSGAASSTKSSFSDVGSAANSNFANVSDAAKSASSDSSSSFQNIASDSAGAFADVGDKAKDGFEGVSDAAENVSESVDDTFANVFPTAAGLAVAAAAALATAVGAIATQAVQVGAEFDKSMSQVAATMGTTVDQIGELRDFAQEMGAKTAFSATQASEALNYMALAGYDAETSMRVLPTVLNLAAAGNMELALASDMVTDAQSALGLSVSEAEVMVDQMAMTSSKTNTSVEQLGNAFLTVGGTAKNLKGGTAELAQMLGILADNGIKGSEGGTALRNVILSLSAPTDTAAKKIQELGLQVFDAEGNMRAMPDIMNDLNASLSSLTQQEKTEALNTIFNKVDLKSVNALLGTSAERYDEVAASIGNAAGAAEKMAETQLDNLAGDVTLLQSAAEGLSIQISDILTPALRSATQFATNAIMPALSGIVANFGKVAVGITTFVGSMAAFKLYNTVIKTMIANNKTAAATISLMGKEFKLTGTAAKVATVSSKAFSTALNALKAAAPMLAITLAVEAVMALADAFNSAQERSQKFEKATSGLKSSLDAENESLIETNDKLRQVDTGKAQKSFSELKNTIDENIDSQAELADKIAESWGDINANSTLLDGYMAVIDSLGEKSGLTAEEQSKLQAAVAGVNEITGSNIEVIDAENGKLSESTDAIRQNIDAWLENARAKAAQEQMVELAKQQLKNEEDLVEATKKYQQAVADRDNAVANGMPYIQSYNAEVARSENLMNEAKEKYDANAEAQERLANRISVTNDALGENGSAISSVLRMHEGWKTAIADMGIDTDVLASKLSELGFTTSDLTNLTTEQLTGLVGVYDGSAAEIVAVCDQLGITVPEKLRKAATDGANAAEQGLKSKNGEATTWGRDLVNNFKAGILSGKDPIKLACQQIASVVKANLGHSIPKEGILREGGEGEKRWGRHLVQNIAKGMLESKSEIEEAADEIAETVQDSLGDIGSDWDAAVDTGEGIARGLMVGFDRVDPMQSMVSSMGALMAMSSMSTTTNNSTTNNWNIGGLVASPDELFMQARVQERHGLAGRW